MKEAKNVRYIDSKARRLMRTLYQAYQDQTHLYAREHESTETAPQLACVPSIIEKYSKEHILFLFFATLLTYRSDSDTWYQQAKEMYERYPELFTRAVINTDELDIQNALVDVGFTFPRQGAGYWKQSGETLFRHFDGNPLGLYQFADVDHFIAYKRILAKTNGGRETLPGLGPKIYSLLGIYYNEIGVLPVLPKGSFPVDLHVMRIAIGTGVLEGEGIADAAKTVAELTRPNIASYCERMGLETKDMAHAFWFLGSRVCYRCDKTFGVDVLCPVYEMCKGTPTTELYGKKGQWNFDTPRMRRGHRQPLLTGSLDEALSLLPEGGVTLKNSTEAADVDYGPPPEQLVWVGE